VIFLNGSAPGGEGESTGGIVAEDIGAMVHQTLLGDALECAQVAVAVFSDDGRYIACNEAFCKLTGYGRDEIMRMRVGVDLAVEEKANTKLFREIVSDKRQIGAGGLKCKDGTAIKVNVWAIETRVANLPYYLVLYWDSSDRPKRRELF
jgi:PAS domain S-box-containing protein